MTTRHFTYNDTVDKSSLKQGDILAKSEELRAHLKKYHAYYADSDDYSHFQVLTQTCDLERRSPSSKCKSPYITIAAVRPLETVILRHIEKSVAIDGMHCCSTSSKAKLTDEVKRIINNNAKDYFFLKGSPSPNEGLTDDSCTFLHLSIAIRAHEQYDMCLKAKVLELNEAFRAKLGWMVGNLYSRVGTVDYVPGALPDNAQFEKYIDTTLDQHVIWVDKDLFTEFRKLSGNGTSIKETTELVEAALRTRKTSKVAELLNVIATETGLSNDQKSKLKALLESEKAPKIFVLN